MNIQYRFAEVTMKLVFRQHYSPNKPSRKPEWLWRLWLWF